jgi:hypothetical protein
MTGISWMLGMLLTGARLAQERSIEYCCKYWMLLRLVQVLDASHSYSDLGLRTYDDLAL